MTAFGLILVGVLIGMVVTVVLVAVVDPGPGRRWRPAGITRSDRGFRIGPPVFGLIAGERVDVRESSLADDMCLWLHVTAPVDRNRPLITDTVAVELPVDAAREVGEQLIWLADNHYQRRYR